MALDAPVTGWATATSRSCPVVDQRQALSCGSLIQVVRRRLGDEFREPAESELSAGVTSPPVSGVRGLPLTPDDFLR